VFVEEGGVGEVLWFEERVHRCKEDLLGQGSRCLAVVGHN
jgi:hypothetical protein